MGSGNSLENLAYLGSKKNLSFAHILPVPSTELAGLSHASKAQPALRLNIAVFLIGPIQLAVPAQSSFGETCSAYVFFTAQPCENPYVSVTDVVKGSTPDCGGCPLVWSGYVTDAILPLPFLPPGARFVGGISSGACSASTQGAIIARLAGLC